MKSVKCDRCILYCYHSSPQFTRVRWGIISSTCTVESISKVSRVGQRPKHSVGPEQSVAEEWLQVQACCVLELHRHTNIPTLCLTCTYIRVCLCQAPLPVNPHTHMHMYKLYKPTQTYTPPQTYSHPPKPIAPPHKPYICMYICTIQNHTYTYTIQTLISALI